MPARTGHTTYVPGKGATTVRNGTKKKFVGKGPAPAGARKVKEPSYTEVPTTTISPTGKVSTSGFKSRKAAKRAVVQTRMRQGNLRRDRQAQATEKRVKATERAVKASRPVKAADSWKFSPTQLKSKPYKGAYGPYGYALGSGKVAKEQSAPERVAPGYKTKTIRTSAPAAKQKISSVPGRNPNLKGTRQERVQARRRVQTTRKAVKRSGPNLRKVAPGIKREVARLSVKAHRKYPDVPVSVMMGDTEQESNFDPGAVSSSNAVGLTQFIPSTAASYGVKEGTGRPEKRSQVFGQAKLLHDLQHEHPGGIKEALGNYYGDPSASYSGEVLEKAQKYKFLDKHGNPKAVADYRAAVKEAKELGLKVAHGNTVSVGPPPKKLVKRTVIAEHAMREIEGSPYVWGGGHGSFESSGYDCSGAVSYVVHKVAPNLLKTPLTSGAMGQVLQPGPGALTVFYNDTHTFLRLINSKGEAEYWGTSVNDSSKGLASYSAPGKEYLFQYNVGHVPGMGKKQALQLGASPGSLTSASSFPGMSLSSGGTTATINPGAGVTVGKPGFSKSPIRLTQQQKARRINRKLKAVGIGTKEAPEETSATLKALERKYGA